MARKNTNTANTNTARNAHTWTDAGVTFTLTYEHDHVSIRASHAWTDGTDGLHDTQVIRAIWTDKARNATNVRVYDAHGTLVGERTRDGVRIGTERTDGTPSADGTERTARALHVRESAYVPMSTSALEAREDARTARIRERMDTRIASAREAVTSSTAERVLRAHALHAVRTMGTHTLHAPSALAETRIRNAIDTQVTHERTSKAREYMHEHAGRSAYGVRPFRVGERIDKHDGGRITATATQIAIDFAKFKAQFYPSKTADGKRIDRVQAKRAPASEHGHVTAVAVTRGAQDGYAPVAEAMRKVCALMCAMYYAVDGQGNIDTRLDDNGKFVRLFDGGLTQYALDHIAQVRAVLIAHDRKAYTRDVEKACKKRLESMLYALRERVTHESEYANERISAGTLGLSAPAPVSDALADFPRLARIVHKYITDEREREIVERVIYTADSMDDIAHDMHVNKSTISRHFNSSMRVLREHEREILRAVRDRANARHIMGTPAPAREDDTRSLADLDMPARERAWWERESTGASADAERAVKRIAYACSVRPSQI